MSLHREVTRQADKLDSEYEMLEMMLGEDREQSEEQVMLALAQAKRVRNESTVLVRVLARLRDRLQSKEDTR
jgi:hypothetical protein